MSFLPYRSNCSKHNSVGDKNGNYIDFNDDIEKHLQIARVRFRVLLEGMLRPKCGSYLDMNTMTMNTVDDSNITSKLRNVGLRPTRQRISLASLLFKDGERHVTAEVLHEESVSAHIQVSLATIYNTLNQFKEAGLLREVAIDGSKTYFDTNTSDHQHFYFEDTGELCDIPGDSVRVAGISQLPEGMEIAGVDVIVRLKRTPAA